VSTEVVTLSSGAAFSSHVRLTISVVYSCVWLHIEHSINITEWINKSAITKSDRHTMLDSSCASLNM